MQVEDDDQVNNTSTIISNNNQIPQLQYNTNNKSKIAAPDQQQYPAENYHQAGEDAVEDDAMAAGEFTPTPD